MMERKREALPSNNHAIPSNLMVKGEKNEHGPYPGHQVKPTQHKKRERQKQQARYEKRYKKGFCRSGGFWATRVAPVNLPAKGERERNLGALRLGGGGVLRHKRKSRVNIEILLFTSICEKKSASENEEA